MIGRGIAAIVVLAWDEEVSRSHAELQRIGDDWVLVDDGLSHNGSFVNGERVSCRQRLHDGNELRFGNTRIDFFAPFEGATQLPLRSASRPTRHHDGAQPSASWWGACLSCRMRAKNSGTSGEEC